MAFGKRREPVEVTVKCFGEDVTFKLRQLSALEVDELKRTYPPPLVPRKEGPDGTILDHTDDEYRRAREVWEDQALLLQICRQIVSPAFESSDPLEQIRELRESFTQRELIDFGSKALLVGRGEITPRDMEAAREQLVPFVNGSPENAETGHS